MVQSRLHVFHGFPTLRADHADGHISVRIVGIGLAGAVFTTMLAQGQSGDPVTLVRAVNAGLLFATGMAILAAVAPFVRGFDYPNERRNTPHQ